MGKNLWAGSGYDYSIAWSTLGPMDSDEPQPTMYNVSQPGKAVLIMEWNFGRNLTWLYWDVTDGFGPGSFAGTLGKSDWNVRVVRHEGGKYGVNNVAFADGHVAPVAHRSESMFWWTWLGSPSPGLAPAAIYPEVSFTRPFWESRYNFRYLGWATIR